MNKEQVLGIVRHVLTFGGGILMAKGFADEALAEELVGGLITVIGGAWSIVAKVKAGKNEGAE
jgi:hypothetical protein